MIQQNENFIKFNEVRKRVMFNSNISLKSKGIFAIIFDFDSKGIPINLKTIEKLTCNGRRTILTGINELIEQGFIIRIDERHSVTKRFVGTFYKIKTI